jgi:hypothetical protein
MVARAASGRRPVNGTTLSLLIGIGASLIANELFDYLAPLARVIAIWSAHRRYAGNPGRAEVREEELTALIGERPGNLLKLLTAFGFAATAVCSTARTALGEHPAVTIGMAMLHLPAIVAIFAVRAISCAMGTAMYGGILGMPLTLAFGQNIGLKTGWSLSAAFFVCALVWTYVLDHKEKCEAATQAATAETR